MEAGALANPRTQDEFKHKSRLLEFAQRASIPLSVYQTCNEGSLHRPLFRSSVIVDGMKFVSPHVFLRQKEAEQNVAKLALDSVLSKMKLEGISLIPDGTQDEFKYKSRLLEFAQRASIPLPVYQTCNEGSLHRPLFRSSVIVDGAKFVCPHVFLRQKEAEQNVAKLALDSVLSKMKLEGISLIPDDTTFCKTILHEYAAKMKIELPRYTTSKSGARFSTFIASVFFDGKTYKGVPARSKRDAEQLGARTVVDWILGKSDRSIVMAEIIKSKGKFFDAFSSGNGSFVPHDDDMPLKTTLDNQHGSIAASEKDMHAGSTAPENNIVLLNASIANHPGYRNGKENSMHVLSSSNLPVPAAVHPTLPAMVENAKEKTRQWNNQPQGSTNGHLYDVISESCPPQDNLFCKSILYEYAAKMRMGLPTYTTSQLAGLFPTFISSVVFDGKMYVGGPGRSKKEAEQFGARTVIDCILGESDMSTVMTEVIKSKGILVDAFSRGSGSIVLQDDNMPLKLTLDNHSDYTAPFENSMHVLPTNGNLPVPADHSILPTTENPKGKTVKKSEPEGSTSGHLGPVSNNSSPAQVIEVETEVVSDDQARLARLSGHMQIPRPSNSKKRSRKNKTRGASKIMRTLPQENKQDSGSNKML